MDSNRKRWNEGQKSLRQVLERDENHQQAIDLFLTQHAMVHDAEMSQSGLHSFAEDVWKDASQEVIRCVPPKFEHSIAWIIWHIARIEDMTMNVLLVGKTQIFHRDDWPARLNITVVHSGNVVMDNADVAKLSQAINVEALKVYRLAVGRSTREAVGALQPEDFKQKVDPAQLQRLLEDGSVSKEAMGLIDYWGSLTKAGLLLMPPTRHNFVHLNEALKVKKKCYGLRS